VNHSVIEGESKSVMFKAELEIGAGAVRVLGVVHAAIMADAGVQDSQGTLARVVEV